jgi:5,10-methylenetetrahydrofolate reductase
MRIVDKIKQAHAEGKTTVSFEFFPAKSEEGTANLLQRVSANTHENNTLTKKHAGTLHGRFP